MSPDYFAQACTATVLKAPAEVAATAASGGVDIQALGGKVMVVAAIFNTAGTNPTLAVKLQAATGSDIVETVTYSGTGTGTITEVTGGPDTVAEDITIHMDSATAFTVTGSVSSTIGTGTVGTKFTSAQISFLITAGGAAFVHTDEFVVHTHVRTYADITGAAFTGATANLGIQKLALDVDKIGQYVRLHSTIGGTDTPKYLVGATIYSLL